MLKFYLSYLIAVFLISGSVAAQVNCKDGQWKIVRSSFEEWEEFQINDQCQMDGHYKYYKENRLRRTGFFKNKERDGIFKYYFRDGTIAETRNYKNDELNGLRTKYYKTPAGQIRETVRYSDGLLNGMSELYNPSGKTTQQVEYSQGLVDGRVVQYDTSNPHRYLVSEIRFYQLGRMTFKEILGHKGKVDFSQDAISDKLKFDTVTIGSTLIMAQFQLKDLLERERLSVLLPSDTCVPERRDFNPAEPQVFLSIDDPTNICLKWLPEDNGKVFYQLFDGEGYLRERGEIHDNQRQGLVEFFRKGQLIYSRKFENGKADKTVLVYKGSEELFGEFQNRTKESSLKLQYTQFDFKLGDFKIVDGRSSCAKALKQRSYFLTDVFKKFDEKNSDSVRYFDETCRQGCAASCLKMAGLSEGRDSSEYMQTGCNLGHQEACKKLFQKHPDLSVDQPKILNRMKTSDCLIGFGKSCFAEENLDQNLVNGLTCLMGVDKGCERRMAAKDAKIQKYAAKCRSEYSSDWCERTAQNLMAQNENKGAKEMLKMLCLENNDHKCVPYSRYIQNAKKRESILELGCIKKNIESCLEIGQKLYRDKKFDDALGVLDGACYSERKPDVIDIQTIASSKACKLAASIVNMREKVELAQKYYCEANLRMGYVKDCSQIKILSRR